MKHNYKKDNAVVTKAVLEKALRPLHKKLEQHDKKLQEHDGRFDRIEAKIEGLDKKINLIDFCAEERFQKLEKGIKELQEQHQRLERRLDDWQEQSLQSINELKEQSGKMLTHMDYFAGKSEAADRETTFMGHQIGRLDARLSHHEKFSKDRFGYEPINPA